MDAWIPFLQSLIWPFFLAVFLVWQRNWVQEMANVIMERIEKGGGFKTPIFELDSTAPKLDAEEAQEADEFLEKIEYEIDSQEYSIMDQNLAVELAKNMYLVHTAEKTGGTDSLGRPYYHVRVQLATANKSFLDRVSKVVYFLHETFSNPIREITRRENNFELDLTAWGQFTLRAEVYLEGARQPITLTRYLNF